MERGIFEKLKTFAGGRVYALQAPQNSKTPFVVFQRIESERWRSVNGPSGMAQARLQVDAYGDDYYTVKELAADIEAALDGFRGTVEFDGGSVNIGGISLQTDEDLLDQTMPPQLYRNRAEYLVTYQQ